MVLWFMEESRNLLLPRAVCSHAIALLDWFWMSGAIIRINQLQELGIACLGLAWKINKSGTGMVPIDQRNFSKANIVILERQLMKALGYHLLGPTLLSIAHELLHQWDSYVKQKLTQPSRGMGQKKTEAFSLKNLPLYLDTEDGCDDAAILQLDQLLSVLDLCSTVLGFLDFGPENLVFNVLFFFVKQKNECRPFESQNSHFPLAATFEEFSEQIPRSGLSKIGAMELHAKLQRYIMSVHNMLCDERRQYKDKNVSYDELGVINNFHEEFCIREAKEAKMIERFEKEKKKKIPRNPWRPMGLLETVLHFQTFKPYYQRAGRALLRHLQPLPQ